MNSLAEILVQLQKAIKEEKDLDRRLNDLEDAAVSIEHEQAPELTRITLLHSNIIRGKLEQSRTFWIRISTILIVALTICICAILLNFTAGK